MMNLIKKVNFRRPQVMPFNGIKTIQAHLDHRAHIENYVNGLSDNRPNVCTTCQVECLLGKTLHDKESAQKMNLDLVNQVCNDCERFLEAAAQVVFHVEMGERKWAQAALREDQLFQQSSDSFQQKLAELYVASWTDDTEISLTTQHSKVSQRDECGK